MLSAVTVYHPDDAAYLWLQARSFRMFAARGLFRKIVIIENPDPRRKHAAERASAAALNMRETIRSAYGDLSSIVEFHDASEVAQFPHMTGWRSQQILKLAASRYVTTDKYVVFDAKNHLVFPIKCRYFVDDAGRAYITNESFRSNPLRVFLENTLRFFKVDPDAHLDSFPQPTTPFVFVTREVDRMIKYIEEREQAPFPSVFMAADIAEFFCYSAYMIFVAGLMDSNYTYRPYQSRVIWAQSKGANSVSAIIEQTEKLGLPVFAVHRRALVGMPKPSINMIGGFWARRGLFPDKDAALRFLIRQAAIERRAYHLKQLRGLKRRLKRAVRGAAV